MALCAEVKDRFAYGHLDSLETAVRKSVIGFRNGTAQVVGIFCYIKLGNSYHLLVDPLLAVQDCRCADVSPIKSRVTAPGRERIDLSKKSIAFDMRALPLRFPGERGVVQFPATLSLKGETVCFVVDASSECRAIAMDGEVNIARPGAIHRLIVEAQAQREHQRTELIAKQHQEIAQATDAVSKKLAQQPREEILGLLPIVSFEQWFDGHHPVRVMSKKK